MKFFKPGLIIFFAAILVFLCHLTTVKYYPLSWFDENYIQEIGRVSIFEQNTEYGMMMNRSTSEPPIPFVHYIGGLIQESLFKISGSYIYSRCFALLGIVFSTMLFYLWLVKKGYKSWIVLITSLLFLSDTNVTVGLHWYRLDMWAISLVLLNAILVLSCYGKNRTRQLWTFFTIGCVMVFQMFFWMTSCLLWPLIFAEALVLANKEKWNINKYLSIISLSLCGIIFMTAILLIPLYSEIKPILIREASEMLGGTVINENTISLYQDCINRIITFIKLIIRTPFIWFGGIIGIILSFRKNKFHFCAFIVCFLVVISTLVYHARVNYLTPLIFLFFTETIKFCFQQKNKILKFLTIIFLAGALVYSFTLSVIGLNYFARPLTNNTYNDLLPKVEECIGYGQKNVFTFTYDIYHVGRKLNWKIYSFHLGLAPLVFEKQSIELLKKMEYVIVGNDYPLTEEQNVLLRENDFEVFKIIDMPKDKLEGLTAKFRPIIYARGYPSFTIWKKQDHY